MRVPIVLPVVLALLQAPARGDARCACLCVDGALKTVCTGAAAAGDHPELCAARAGQACPPPPEASAARQRYAAPVDGVAHCRGAGIFDPVTDGYLTARVCDAVPGGDSDAGSGQAPAREGVNWNRAATSQREAGR